MTRRNTSSSHGELSDMAAVRAAMPGIMLPSGEGTSENLEETCESAEKIGQLKGT